MMRVAPFSYTAPLMASVLAVAFFSGSCQREHPTAPDVPAATTVAGEGKAHATAQTDGNRPPTAVFKTTPPANDESVIVGGRSLDVTFNLCQSSDPDEGDELRFSFDWDNDGKEDEYGHCRATHHYEVGEFDSACVYSRVCVSDRQPQHEVCHTYQVCTFGRPRPSASPSSSPTPEPTPEPTPTPDPGLTDQHKEGDFTPPWSKDVWAFTASTGTDVTVRLDTVSEASAYVMAVCISKSTRRADCITPTFTDRVDCSFGDPLAKCPVKSVVLPENGGRYHVLVTGFRLHASEDGRYVMRMTAHPGTGPLTLEADNVAWEPID